jgi:Flp pilus assembly protein CpaB
MARMQGLTLSRGNRGLLIVAALAGLAAAVLFVVAVNQDGTSSNTGSGGGTETAVVADQNIAYGQEISADMLKVRSDVPNGQVVTGALPDITKVVGKRARIAIAAQEQITPAKIGEGIETGEGVTWIVPPGMRAFAFEANEIKAVGGQLLPTDRVDVIARFKIKGVAGLADNQYILRTEYLFENVEVLAVGQEKGAPAPVSNSAADADGEPDSRSQLTEDVQEQPGATTVTLTLTPEQVQQLTSAQGWADTIGLAARPAGETGKADLPPIEITITE